MSIPTPTCGFRAEDDEQEKWRCSVAATVGRNPFGVAITAWLGLDATPSPRVAEYGNPGLEDATPSGSPIK